MYHIKMKRFEEPKSGTPLSHDHPPSTIHHPPPKLKKNLRHQDEILIKYKRIKWTPSCKASLLLPGGKKFNLMTKLNPQ